MALQSIKSVFDLGSYFWEKYFSTAEKGEGTPEKGEGTKKRKRIEQSPTEFTSPPSKMNRDFELNLNDIEYDAMKQVFYDYSMGTIRVTGRDYWQRFIWTELSHVYNTRAEASGLCVRPWSDMIKGGRTLHTKFCYQRANQTVRDEMLFAIFEPCHVCRDRIPVLPISLLRGTPSSSSFGSRNQSFHTEAESRRSGHNSVRHEGLPSLQQLVDLCFNMMRANFLTENQFSSALILVEEWLSSGRRNAWLIYLYGTNESLQEKANFLIQQMR